jgi:hypothetical protein
VVDLGRKRAEAGLVGRDLAGECHAQVSAAVKGAVEADDARATGVGTGDLDGVLDRFGTGREERRLLREAAGHALVDLLGQRDVRRIRHHLVSGVHELLQLGLHCGDDLRMAVPGVEHGDAAAEIDVAAALHIPEAGVLGTCGVERVAYRHASRSCEVLARVPIRVAIPVRAVFANRRTMIDDSVGEIGCRK